MSEPMRIAHAAGYVMATLAAAALAGCGGGDKVMIEKPIIELIPISEMLAHPIHGEAVRAELDELLAGHGKNDVRRVPTAVLTPAGYICFLRIRARPPGRQVLVQTLRLRRSLSRSRSTPTGRLYKLHVCWLDKAGRGLTPFTLSRRADLAGRRRKGIWRISEDLHVAFQVCDYPCTAPPLGRKRICRTRSQEQIAARHRMIKTEGEVAMAELKFTSDLRTGKATLRLTGEHLNLTLDNRTPRVAPTTRPTTQPAEKREGNLTTKPRRTRRTIRNHG